MARLVLSLVLSLLLAAALAWLSHWGQEAVVSFFIRQTRLDLSLNLFVVLVLLAFAVFYILVRTLGLFANLPEKAQAWRRTQAQRTAYKNLTEASLHFLSGRYLKASAALRPLFEKRTSIPIARLMAAQAAQEVRNLDERDGHMVALEAHLKGISDKSERHAWRDIMLLRQAHWALRARDPQEALAYLSQLSSASARKVLYLRAKLKAAQMAGQTQTALDTARLLARHGAFSDTAARSLLHSLMLTLIKQSQDGDALMRVWRGWSASDRSDALLSCAMADQLHRLSQAAPEAQKIQHADWARKALLPIAQRYALWSDPIKEVWVRSLARHWLGIDAPSIAQIEELQKTHPADACAQFLLGTLTHHLGLWGKAERMLKLALKSPSLPPALRATAWRIQAQLAEQQGNLAAAKEALQHALHILDTP